MRACVRTCWCACVRVRVRVSVPSPALCLCLRASVRVCGSARPVHGIGRVSIADGAERPSSLLTSLYTQAERERHTDTPCTHTGSTHDMHASVPACTACRHAVGACARARFALSLRSLCSARMRACVRTCWCACVRVCLRVSVPSPALCLCLRASVRVCGSARPVHGIGRVSIADACRATE